MKTNRTQQDTNTTANDTGTARSDQAATTAAWVEERTRLAEGRPRR